MCDSGGPRRALGRKSSAVLQQAKFIIRNPDEITRLVRKSLPSYVTILDRRNPSGRVPLLATNAAVPIVPGIGEPVRLRAPRRELAAIAGRYLEAQHILHAVARDPEMPNSLTLARPLRTGQANLPIQIHGGNPPPSLPPERQRCAIFSPPAA